MTLRNAWAAWCGAALLACGGGTTGDPEAAGAGGASVAGGSGGGGSASSAGSSTGGSGSGSGSAGAAGSASAGASGAGAAGGGGGAGGSAAARDSGLWDDAPDSGVDASAEPTSDAGGTAGVDAGLDAGPEADCSMQLIEVGAQYGAYVVEEIAMDAPAPGLYTLFAGSATEGSVALRHDGGTVDELAYVWQQTVSATDPAAYATFAFDGRFSVTVRKAGTGTQNLYGMPESIFDGKSALIVSDRATLAVPLQTGSGDGAFVIDSVAAAGAPCGLYTLHTSTPDASSASLHRNGEPVASVPYVWQTTISATDPASFHDFVFPDLLSVTVRKDGSGTRNLYELNLSFFDGGHVLVLPN